VHLSGLVGGRGAASLEGVQLRGADASGFAGNKPDL